MLKNNQMVAALLILFATGACSVTYLFEDGVRIELHENGDSCTIREKNISVQLESPEDAFRCFGKGTQVGPFIASNAEEA